MKTTQQAAELIAQADDLLATSYQAWLECRISRATFNEARIQSNNMYLEALAMMAIPA